MNSISLIKLKENFKLKGRIVADGRKQRTIYFKEEATSSTCYNGSLMMSLLIDAFEKRIVATSDVSGAYLHVPMKYFTVLKFTGEYVESLCIADERYKKFVTKERGKCVIHV